MSTKVALVLDVSGSMSSIARKMADAVNSMVDTMNAQDPETLISLTLFDNHIRTDELVKAGKLKQRDNYGAGGSTALFDAVASGINKLGNNSADNHLVLVFTDGEENASHLYNSAKLQALMQTKERDGNWTITFQLPPRAKANFCRQFGIDPGNVREWENNTAGVVELESVTTSSLHNYYTAVKSGARSVKGFYNVTTDMSQIAPTDVKGALVNEKKNFKLLQVDKESDIKPFVEAKTGNPYKKGIAFYELTKPEKVQPNKDIAIMEKNKSDIWAGNQARALIGLPTDGVTYSKVNPGNHANYRIFVKSNSVNRKLVRGTSLLVRV